MFGLFSKSNVKGVSGKEVRDLIKSEKDLIILDIRTSMEVSGGKIPNSKHIDFYSSSFQKEIDNFQLFFELLSTKPTFAQVAYKELNKFNK